MKPSHSPTGRSTHIAGTQRSGRLLADAVDATLNKSMASAAEAMRQTEVDAANRMPCHASLTALERLSIDELRAIANELQIPARGEILDQNDLIAAIRCRL